MSEWHPIQTAPKDGTAVLVFDPTKHPTSEEIPGKPYTYRTNREVTRARIPFIAWWRESDGLNKAGWYDGLFCFPTHWMPIPTPPSGEKKPFKHDEYTCTCGFVYNVPEHGHCCPKCFPRDTEVKQ